MIKYTVEDFRDYLKNNPYSSQFLSKNIRDNITAKQYVFTVLFANNINISCWQTLKHKIYRFQ